MTMNYEHDCLSAYELDRSPRSFISRPDEDNTRVIPYCPQTIHQRAFVDGQQPHLDAPANWMEIHNHPAQNKVIIAGRRGGKSTGVINHIVKRAITVPKHVIKLFGYNLQSWYIGPTYRQARDIAWEKMKYYTNSAQHRKVSPRETTLEIKLQNNMWLKIKGADKPDRLEGLGLWDVALDEVAEMLEAVWIECIEPALTDDVLVANGGGHSFLITTPKGEGWVHDLYNLGKDDPTLEWKSWRYASWQADYVNLAKLRKIYYRLKERGDLDTWRQEYAALFIAFAGRIYRKFSRETNVIGNWELNPNWNIFVGIDPGAANPTHALIGGVDFKGKLWVRDEWVMKGVSIREHTAAIKERLRTPDGKILKPKILVMDPAAKQLFYEFAEKGLSFSRAHNDVRAGIERVRDYLIVDRRTGMSKINVHPDCGILIKQMLKYRWKPQKNKEQNQYEQPYKFDDHGPDALRYVVMTRFPNASFSDHSEPIGIQSRMKADIESCLSNNNDEHDYEENPLIGN